MSRQPSRSNQFPSLLGFLWLSGAFGLSWAAEDPGKSRAPTATPAPELNGQILEYAREQVGVSVQDGECTSLVIEALKQAGARRFPPYGRDADYVWGDLLNSRSQLRPGDILQFRDVIFRGRQQQVEPDGTSSIRFYRTSFHHHSAIVDEVREKGKVLVILHQNAGNDDEPEEDRRRVHRDQLRLADQRPGEGKIWFYRPVSRNSDETEAETRPSAHAASAKPEAKNQEKLTPPPVAPTQNQAKVSTPGPDSRRRSSE